MFAAQRLLAHRVGDADDLRRQRRGLPLEQLVDGVHHARRRRGERQAVDRVDDRRHLRPVRRPAADDAGLAGVRVDDVGLELLQQLR